MSQYIEFATNHTMLVIAFFALSLIIIFTEIKARLSNIQSIGHAQATHLINKENAVLIDVREKNELKEGKIANAVHFPLSTLKNHLNELDQYKDRPVIAYCKSGHRSSQACSMLAKAGFTNIANLNGGFISWVNANLPISKS